MECWIYRLRLKEKRESGMLLRESMNMGYTFWRDHFIDGEKGAQSCIFFRPRLRINTPD